MVHDADADDHHGEYRGRQGRTEQGGEKGRHARHGGGAQVPVIQMEQPSRLVADGTAHLQRGALPSGGAAAQVGQHRAQEDGGQQKDGQALAQVHGVNDVVGALSLGFCQLVKGHDHQARQRQAP